MATPKRGLGRSQPEFVRCAIYTRKSTEEGLEQEFNSLNAQREACAAYILSQRHEGWVELPNFYDDGGYSGGNMERPGLRQLLADVASGKVDVVVLYKIDRLTRSLADFARIVEVLDKAGASFVSVTQSFNTTTSMGRLTLNVLLSFAQFEREVTGERIRDKVAASKAKGMWMGGVVPLGYQVNERKLVIDEAEAATIRMIFERYAELGSTTQLAEELWTQGVLTKRRILRNGREYGARPFSRGALAHLLKNRIYIGEITHREQAYSGEHPPIVDRHVWDRAQALLAENRRERRHLARAAEPSLLVGMISDGLGRPMTPTHATKGTRRYRYYASRTEAGDPHRPWRLPAHALEQAVIRAVSRMVGEGRELTARLAPTSGETAELIDERCLDLAKRLDPTQPRRAGTLLAELGVCVQVHDNQLVIGANPEALLSVVLRADAKWLAIELVDDAHVELTVPVEMRRRGQELRLVFAPAGGAQPAEPDEKLVQLLAKAHQARETLLVGKGHGRAGDRPHLTRLARLSYLAPDITSAILEGKQPVELSARHLLRIASLPHCWNRQRAELGFS